MSLAYGKISLHWTKSLKIQSEFTFIQSFTSKACYHKLAELASVAK